MRASRSGPCRVFSLVHPPDSFRRQRRSPFLSAGAAARVTGLSSSTLLSRLRSDALPGYELGGRWFVPEEELRRALSSRAPAADPDSAAAEAVRELTAHLPRTLDAETLAVFFGVRRGVVGEVLGIPRRSLLFHPDRVTTAGVLGVTLLHGRNGSRYFPVNARSVSARAA